jgi:hypothetical protein
MCQPHHTLPLLPLLHCTRTQALYNFVGAVEVLQPRRECDFVQADEGHSMLPPDAALYRLTEPVRPSSSAGRRGVRRSGSRSGGRSSGTASPSSTLRSSFSSLSALTSSLSSASLSSAFAELTSNFALGGSASVSGRGASGGGRGMVAVPVSAAEAAAGKAAGAAAASVGSNRAAAAPASCPSPSPSTLASVDDDGLTLGDAILTFMNSPHPLQTLKEVRAYGPNGSISRYHNPNSYTKALLALTTPGGSNAAGAGATRRPSGAE